MRNRISLAVASILLVLILVFTDFGNSSSVKVYDCSMTEWHPDIPPRVKEACREIIFEELERQKQEEQQKRMIRT
jgi:hypothetical protein